MWGWMLVLGIMFFSPLISAESTVLAISGSTRQDSYHKKLATEAARIAEKLGAKATVIDLKEYPIPFYDGDLESEIGMPEKAQEIRNLMMQSQVIILSSPEYNGSLSAVLKNVIDWASRDGKGGPSREAFKGKTFVLMSTSPGPSGGSYGLEHLKTIIERIGGRVFSEQLIIPYSDKAFDKDGNLINKDAIEYLQRVMPTVLGK